MFGPYSSGKSCTYLTSLDDDEEEEEEDDDCISLSDNKYHSVEGTLPVAATRSMYNSCSAMTAGCNGRFGEPNFLYNCSSL